MTEIVSIEVTRRCAKACSFCYNGSNPHDNAHWTPDEFISFAKSIIADKTKAISIGGGEPLEYAGLETIFNALRDQVFLSMTTNGLLLDQQLARISSLSPNKVHLSLHFPEREKEVNRIIRQAIALRNIGIHSGVNLLVRRDSIDICETVAAKLRQSGIGNHDIMYLPMRGKNTPSAEMISIVAGKMPFQSMTCLSECGPSPRFSSIDAEKRVAHCSYTTERRKLETLDATGLRRALHNLGLIYCGDQTPLMPAQSLHQKTKLRHKHN